MVVKSSVLYQIILRSNGKYAIFDRVSQKYISADFDTLAETEYYFYQIAR